MPILVNGLVAQKGSIFIVENPEAHLHPKAQSNIGLFLGYLAMQGLNVVIETHSEHVINGIRKILINRDFDLGEVNILFFKEIGENARVVLSRFVFLLQLVVPILKGVTSAFPSYKLQQFRNKKT